MVKLKNGEKNSSFKRKCSFIGSLHLPYFGLLRSSNLITYIEKCYSRVYMPELLTVFHH